MPKSKQEKIEEEVKRKLSIFSAKFIAAVGSTAGSRNSCLLSDAIALFDKDWAEGIDFHVREIGSRNTPELVQLLKDKVKITMDAQRRWWVTVLRTDVNGHILDAVDRANAKSSCIPLKSEQAFRDIRRGQLSLSNSRQTKDSNRTGRRSRQLGPGNPEANNDVSVPAVPPVKHSAPTACISNDSIHSTRAKPAATNGVNLPVNIREEEKKAKFAEEMLASGNELSDLLGRLQISANDRPVAPTKPFSLPMKRTIVDVMAALEAPLPHVDDDIDELEDIYPLGLPERQETNTAMDLFDGTVPSTSAAAGIAPTNNANLNTKSKFQQPPNTKSESEWQKMWKEEEEDPVESYNSHLQQNGGWNGDAQQQEGGNKTPKSKTTKYTSCDADMTDSEADSDDDENTVMDVPTGRKPANNANGGTSNVPLLPSVGLSCHTRVLQEFMGGKIAEQRKNKNGTIGTCGTKQAHQQRQRKPTAQNWAFQPQYGDSSEEEDNNPTKNSTGRSVSNQQQNSKQTGVEQVQANNNGIGLGGNKISAYTPQPSTRPTAGLGSIVSVPNSAYNPPPPLASLNNNSAAFNRVPVNPMPVAPPSLHSQQFAPPQPVAGQWNLMGQVEQMREMANGMQLSHESRPDEGSFTFRRGNLLLTFAEFEDKLRGSIYSHGKIIDERYYPKVDFDMFRLVMMGAIQQVFS